MLEKEQSSIKIDRELFYRLKVISTRKRKPVPECIADWVAFEEGIVSKQPAPIPVKLEFGE